MFLPPPFKNKSQITHVLFGNPAVSWKFMDHPPDPSLSDPKAKSPHFSPWKKVGFRSTQLSLW
jgi:hypothetical protein